MTVYRKAVDFEGNTVLRDKHGYPPPGDPDGDWRWMSTQLARGHRMQELYGWEYTSTTGAAPKGDGWEVNEYVGDSGYGESRRASGQVEQVTYWRRRKP